MILYIVVTLCRIFKRVGMTPFSEWDLNKEVFTRTRQPVCCASESFYAANNNVVKNRARRGEWRLIMKLFKSNVLENGEQRRKTFQNIRPSNINISGHYCFSISDIDGIVYLDVS